MNSKLEQRVREICQEVLAELLLKAKKSTAPPCPYCGSDATNWHGSNRVRCRDCKKTKTIKGTVVPVEDKTI